LLQAMLDGPNRRTSKSLENALVTKMPEMSSSDESRKDKKEEAKDESELSDHMNIDLSEYV